MDQIISQEFADIAARFAAIAVGRPGWSGACAVYVGGEAVLDVWAGPAYDGTQIQSVYSVTKGVGAACVALLSQRGLVDYDAPMCTYWPEFAGGNKGHVTVRTVLSHQAGLPTVDGGYSVEEYIAHDGLAARLAAQMPLWEPGTRHGYHGLTMGTLFRELVTRVSGRSTREFYNHEIASPNNIDFTIGCPAEQRHRVSPPFFPDLGAPPSSMLQLMTQDPIRTAAMASGFPFPRTYEPMFMDADLPAANGFASARGIAQLYAALSTGLGGRQPVLSPETCARVGERQAAGPDAVLPVDMAFGLGFMVPMERIPQGGPGSFGHDGAAGALGFATPALGLSFGWVSDTALSMGADPAASEIATATSVLLAAK